LGILPEVAAEASDRRTDTLDARGIEVAQATGPNGVAHGEGAAQRLRAASGVMAAPAADRAEIARFVNLLFPYASEGGTVSLRAFYDDELARKRNDQLHRNAFYLAARAKDGLLDWQRAERALDWAAGSCGLPPQEYRRTIRSAARGAGVVAS
jgi:hypothetical protein